MADRDHDHDLRRRYFDAISSAPGLGLTVVGAVDAVLAVRDEEMAALRKLTSTCSCSPNPETYEGPEADCPIHGAIRGMNEAMAANARVRSLHSESPHKPGLCCCGNPCPCPTIRALDEEASR